MNGSWEIEDALRRLGDRLEFDDAPRTALLVGGGAALRLLGLVSRTTKDVDVVAIVTETAGVATKRLRKADPLPESLRLASEKVANDLGITTDWLNAGPASLMDFGMPEGCIERSVVKHYGSRLSVYFLSRLDQIHLKLYAAVDQGGRHLSDLRTLDPSAPELAAAAKWAITHDPSPGFRQSLSGLLTHLGFADVAERI